MLLAPGTQLGRYAVTALVGAGGMGEVYKATDTRLNRSVALKVLPEGMSSDPERRRLFEREAMAVASLSHPNICTLYDVGSQDGVEFLVMEYLAGETLAHRLARGALAAPQAIRYALAMADALEAAHAHGIVHRDFKPANVKLTGDGTVKLLDFGIATIVARRGGDASSPLTAESSRAIAGAIIGTPSYMSPEQVRGSAVDRRADIWAFGCVLFEMLTGRKAFVGDTGADITLAILAREPDLAELPAGLPPAVRRVLQRCLEKDAGRRLHDIADARTELEDAAMPKAGARAKEQQPSIAVLPFANMSADPENEYFSDGLAEEILNSLTRIRGLKVIARTSSFAFRGKHEDIRRIAEALDVTTVLEGSIRKAGKRIRVTAQLIAAADGSHVWSERYDRELSDIFAVQDEMAEAISAALRVTFAAPSAEPHKRTPKLAAYEAYLKGKYLWDRGAGARSKELLERAIAADPEFALAHYGLGRYYFLSYVGQLMPPHEAVPLVRKHATDALRCDPSLPEAHGLLGSLAALYDYDWDEADRHFRAAFANGPVSIEVRWHRSNFYWAHAGRAQEAVEDLTRAREEDPLNPVILWTLAVSLRASHRDKEADAAYQECVELDVGYLSTISAVVLSGNHLARGETAKALAFAELAHGRHPQVPYTIGQLAAALTRSGQHERAAALLEQLRPGDAFGAPFGLALAAIGAEALDEAAHWLEKAIEQRDLWASFLLNVGNIGGRVMWSSPRWPQLAKLMNVDAARAHVGAREDS
jgi:serine/threonine protein kinase/Tfp pilus assembly protein PilF